MQYLTSQDCNKNEVMRFMSLKRNSHKSCVFNVDRALTTVFTRRTELSMFSATVCRVCFLKSTTKRKHLTARLAFHQIIKVPGGGGFVQLNWQKKPKKQTKRLHGQTVKTQRRHLATCQHSSLPTTVCIATLSASPSNYWGISSVVWTQKSDSVPLRRAPTPHPPPRQQE